MPSVHDEAKHVVREQSGATLNPLTALKGTGIMKRSIFAVFFFIIVLNRLSLAAGSVTNSQMGYSIFLPDNWIIKVVSDSQHIIYDSTSVTSGIVGIVRHPINNTSQSSQEWSRAYFLANLLVARYGADPRGAVLYIDSSQQSTQGSLWAPELYIEYYSLDTSLKSYREFVRFPASSRYGYELYAMADTADMNTNVGLYVAMLKSIQLPGDATAARSPAVVHGPAPLTAPQRQMVFTPMGRVLPGALLRTRSLPPGLYLQGSSKVVAGMH
jgi:hypothetical protein